MKALPKARRSDLVVTEVDNELLVYDVKANRALCLNESAAAIWKKCDGTASLDDIAGSTLLDKALVKMALGDLSANKLLDDGLVAKTDRITRRKVLLGAATALAAIPVILTIVAPAAAQAASCVASGLTVTITNSPAAAGSTGCQTTATGRCCSLSSSNFMFTTNLDGSINCTVICGTVIG